MKDIPQPAVSDEDNAVSLPGFVDLQVNGYDGVDFTSPDVSAEDVLRCAARLRELGTAGFLATIVTAPPADIENSMKAVSEAMRQQGPDGNILGIHLEGPFISPEQGYRGAHREKCIREADLLWFRKLQDLAQGCIRIVTVAPETPRIPAFIEAVRDKVLVACGHTNTDYASLRAAVNAGLSLVTHFGNGCRHLIDRHRNPLVNMLACSELTLGFISDGHHLPEPFLRMLANCVPVERLFVVSDSVHFGGLAPGVYDSGFGPVRVDENGRLCLASDANVLAGSAATMMECMNHLASLRIYDESDLLKIGFETPLRLLGLDAEAFAKREGHMAFDTAAQLFVQT